LCCRDCGSCVDLVIVEAAGLAGHRVLRLVGRAEQSAAHDIAPKNLMLKAGEILPGTMFGSGEDQGRHLRNEIALHDVGAQRPSPAPTRQNLHDSSRSSFTS
jgi:hypothetical protein